MEIIIFGIWFVCLLIYWEIREVRKNLEIFAKREEFIKKNDNK